MRPDSGLAAAVLVPLLAVLSPAAEPRGPAIGNNGYRGEVRDDGAPDADDFVGPLIAGESLSVEVRSEEDGALLPSLLLLDPSGADRTPPLRKDPSGRRAGFRRFVADRTGRWVVRVAGREETEGAYLVRFRVGRARPGRVRVRPGGGTPGVAVQPFEAVRGSVLDLRLGPVGASPLPRLLEILDPAGREVPAASGLLERRAGAVHLRGLPLDGEDGTWRAVVGLDAGEERAVLDLRVAPPRRPRGTASLSPVEPRLDPREEPAAALAGTAVRLAGRGFAEGPAPTVLVGDRPAEVTGIGPGGAYLDVRLPSAEPGTVADIVVVNPDGQSCEGTALVRWLSPGPPLVRGFLPPAATLMPGSALPVNVTLSALAPAEGVEVVLESDGGPFTAPASVRVPPFASEGTFDLVAGPVPGKGVLTAALGTSVSLAVEVVSPPSSTDLDLSGWRLVQTDTARTWALPAGTRLAPGQTLVVARNAPRGPFETFWNVTLGSGVVFLDSGDRFPSFNGDETVSLQGASGLLVDGPTPKLVAGTGHRRIPGSPPGPASSWIADVAAPSTCTPGLPAPGEWSGISITEYADPAGTGNFVYEFLEIHFAGN